MAPGDLPFFLQSLQGADKAADEDSPYLPFVNATDAATAQLQRQGADPNRPLTGGGLLGMFAAGLAGGVGHNLESGYKAQQNDIAAQQMEDVMNGRAISAQPGQSPSVFSAVRNAGLAQQLGVQQQKEEEARQLANEEILKKTPGTGTSTPLDAAGQALANQLGLPPGATKEDLELATQLVTANFNRQKELLSTDAGKAATRSKEIVPSADLAAKAHTATGDLQLLDSAAEAAFPNTPSVRGQMVEQIKNTLTPTEKAWGAIKQTMGPIFGVDSGFLTDTRRAQLDAQVHNSANTTQNEFASTKAQLNGGSPQQQQPTDLRSIAKQFPNSPEGKAAFKAYILKMGQ